LWARLRRTFLRMTHVTPLSLPVSADSTSDEGTSCLPWGLGMLSSVPCIGSFAPMALCCWPVLQCSRKPVWVAEHLQQMQPLDQMGIVTSRCITYVRGLVHSHRAGQPP
jgi:hypothetical protein